VAKYVVARVDEIPPGERLIIDVRGRSVGIFNLGGAFYALRNSCPHEGGPVCAGDLVGLLESDGPGQHTFDPNPHRVQCPWHGWEYDIRTGQSWCEPDSNATRSYSVAVQSGQQIAGEIEGAEDAFPGLEKGPYLLETFQVSVEHDYVVLTM
jgi:3-phenylpropionate/trans-cinnamate dioxygenase ferredoxin subunit